MELSGARAQRHRVLVQTQRHNVENVVVLGWRVRARLLLGQQTFIWSPRGPVCLESPSRKLVNVP